VEFDLTGEDLAVVSDLDLSATHACMLVVLRVLEGGAMPFLCCWDSGPPLAVNATCDSGCLDFCCKSGGGDAWVTPEASQRSRVLSFFDHVMVPRVLSR